MKVNEVEVTTTTVSRTYEAMDGTIFESSTDCAEYEKIVNKAKNMKAYELLRRLQKNATPMGDCDNYNYLRGYCSCDDKYYIIKFTENVMNDIIDICYCDDRSKLEEKYREYIGSSVLFTIYDGEIYVMGTAESILMDMTKEVAETFAKYEEKVGK